MKPRLLLIVLLCTLLSSCADRATIPAPATVAPEATATPVPTPIDPEQQWRIVYVQSALLRAACSTLFETHWAYSNGEITLERARVELQAEAGIVQAARTDFASLPSSGGATGMYATGFDQPLTVLENVLASGEERLIENEYEVWHAVNQACVDLGDLQETMLADALAAGLSQSTLDRFDDEAGDGVIGIYDSTEWGRTDADRPQPEAAAATTRIPATEAASGDGQLIEIWRPVYAQGALLFETCTMTYNTHADFGQGAINLERATAELEAESRFVEYVLRGITSTIPGSESAASHTLQVENQATVLVDWLDPGSTRLGSAQALDAIGRACSALQSEMDSIVADGTAAGLSAATWDLLDSEMTPIIEDLYDQTWYGR